MHPFSLEFTRKPNALWGAASGFILENGIRIASFRRPGPKGGYIAPIDYRFFSSQSAARFSDFTGELTVEETIEAIYPGDVSRGYHVD